MLLTRVCNRLKQKQINVGELRLFTILCFPGDWIPHSTDIEDIFEAITRNQFWDYWNYSLLEEIVQQFGAGDAEMLSWVNDYKHDLAGFKACTKIIDYMPVLESDSSFDDSDADEPTTATPAKYDRRYRRQLSIKLKVNLAEHSLLYIDRLWNSIAEVLLLPPLSALLDCIRKGCITVVLLIPTGVIPRFLQQVPRVSTFFRAKGIQSVCLEKCCIFSDVIAVQPRPNEKVYNCVPQMFIFHVLTLLHVSIELICFFVFLPFLPGPEAAVPGLHTRRLRGSAGIAGSWCWC